MGDPGKLNLKRQGIKPWHWTGVLVVGKVFHVGLLNLM